jgi:ketosteroid isomerase-like protein
MRPAILGMVMEPIQVVRAAMDAVSRQDIEAVERLASDGLEFNSAFAASEGRTFSGPTAVRDYFDAVGEAFDDVSITLEEMVGAEGERVFIHARVRGRGRGSGIVVDHLYGQVYTVREGLIARIDSFIDPAEAARYFNGGD